MAVLALEGEQARAPAFGRDPGALSGDGVVGRIGQITHHLPADGRVAI
jgi:hypothetical protein